MNSGSLKLILFALFLSVGGVPGLNAQTVVNMPNVNDRPSLKAVQLQISPVIDGKVIDDPVWEPLTPAEQLIQTKPSAGFPASERTQIRIGYTATSLYLAVVCYDKEPGRLVVSDARRDATLDNTDSFLFILDTYHDGQNGFIFGTNPIGIEYDGQVDNEGQGNFSQNRQQQGTIGGFNLNWDAAFTVKSVVGDFGWSAEFEIPLRTLRFASGQNQVWGINFQRNIRKTNEIAYWAALPIQFDLKRLSLEGTLTGLNLQSPGNLKFIPYVLGKASKDFQTVPAEAMEYKPAFGADIKYSVTPAVTLDLTYNTDFAQVEVDQQQINLDRFNLFFPEKRPFFLENAGQFTVGSPGEVDLFFSRRIGIGPNGEIVPIIGGARLSGKLNNTNLGFLTMYTNDVGSLGIEKNNFSVARINQQLALRSSLGGIFVSRLGMESPDDYNRTYGVDGKWGIGKKATVSGYYAKTESPQDSLNTQSYKLAGNYEWNGLRATLAYTEVGEGFNPEVGYLFRSGFRKPEALIFQQVRMNGKYGLLELRPHVSYRGYWNYSDFLETSFLHVDNHWVWINGLEIHTGINFTTEGVVNPFQISGITVDPGTYDHEEAQIIVMTNASKMFYFNTRSILGGSFGGTRYVNSGTLGFRLGDKFNSEYSLTLNDVRLPNGSVVSKLFAGRISYSFTPRVNFQAFAQYNSDQKLWSFNLRFSLLEQANTGLFVVYNDIYTNGLPNNRSFTIKYTRMFDLMGGGKKG
jgi:hypothetical protein